jgi:hypothetical protein
MLGRVVGGGRKKMHSGFWWVNINNIDYVEKPGVCGRTILKQIEKN